MDEFNCRRNLADVFRQRQSYLLSGQPVSSIKKAIKSVRADLKQKKCVEIKYRGESSVESTLLKQETFLKSGLIGLVDALLTHGHNQFRVRGNFLAHLDCLGNQFFWRKNSTNESCILNYDNVSVKWFNS